MALTEEDIINKLIVGEDYFASLMEINSNNIKLGLPYTNISKINYTFHVIKALRYRVDRDVFDEESTKLYYKIIKLLPINLV